MIREANEKDFNVLNDMVKELDSNYRFDIKNPFFKCLVYEKKEIVGFLKYSKIYENIEIDYIYVKKEYRGMNIATNLLKKIEKDVEKITLEVNEKNESAIKLYEKNGYGRAAIKKNYYGADSAILMIKEL